jgi:hypothetical protein
MAIFKTKITQTTKLTTHMAQRSKPRLCYTVKTYQNYIYSWCPQPNNYGQSSAANNLTNQTPFYCSAIPYSQGQDWVTTYAYNINVIDGQVERSAYVACDYVE